jgi:HPt (histidine-containing phosphotransfer) domain-containing protein
VSAPSADTPIVSGQLSEVSGGDAEVEREILSEFRGATQADAIALEQSLAEGDIDAVRRAAHRMKGASRMVGALDLALACEHLEKAAEDNDLAAAVLQRPGLVAEIERLGRYLDKL